MRLLPVLLIVIMVASCGCISEKPHHDFKVNETRYFDFVYDDLHYGGNLKWDGEHFYIRAQFHGYKKGMFINACIIGRDDDAKMSMFGVGDTYEKEHVDFSRTVLLDKMIRNPVNQS